MRDITSEMPLPPGLSVDWRLDRDLACPHCRYNLRGLRTPRCVECGANFRWQTLVAVECPRCEASVAYHDGETCPRCGLTLQWGPLLAETPLRGTIAPYEYTPRFGRALAGALLRGLLPRRVWRVTPLEAPAVARRLSVLYWIGAAVLLLGVMVFQAPLIAARDARMSDAAAIAALFALPVVTRLMMPIFSPTLTRFRIRRDRLARAWAYGAVGWFWMGVALLIATLVIELCARWWLTPMATPRLFFSPRMVFGSFVDLDDFGVWDDVRFWWRHYRDAYVFSCAFSAVLLWFGALWWWLLFASFLHRHVRLSRTDAWALFLSTQVTGVVLLLPVLGIAHALHVAFGI
ncbi:MAG: hypothetical protein AB7Q17_00425 [Phycisphaerae bacterium]